MNIEILRMVRANTPARNSDIVAFFQAIVGDFRLRCCSVRRRHTDGELFIALPGRQEGGISFMEGETKDRLKEMALEDYERLVDE